MTYTHTATPKFVQSLIALSNTRKQLLAAAVDNAHKSLEASAQTQWQPYVETAAEQRSRARAERIAWVIDSL